MKWVIDNAMATERMALWAGLSTNGSDRARQALTGQAYGGDPQKCMDALAKDIDAKVKDAGLL